MQVLEIFTSIQGEGMKQGYRATFIRFAGCNLKCSFCDTQEIMAKESKFLTIGEILSQVPDEVDLVVLTGGEPLLQNRIDFDALVTLLIQRNHTVGIETNGTIPYTKDDSDDSEDIWITVSPKRETNYYIGPIEPDEIKIVEDPSVTTALLDELEARFPDKYLILQVQSCSPESWKRMLELQEACPSWIVKVQLHQMMQVQ